MGYFQVRYDSRVVIYDCRIFIRLATSFGLDLNEQEKLLFIQQKQSSWIQTNKTGQPYSDTSPYNGEYNQWPIL